MQPKLHEHLKNFKTIEDFRVVEPEIDEMLQGVGSLNRGRNFHRYRSVSESDGTAVVTAAAVGRRPNTTITNRSDYVGNRPQYQQQHNQQNQQQQHQYQQQQHQHQHTNYSNFSSNRRRTGSFGSGNVRVRSGSLGNKPQVANRNHHYGSPNEMRRSAGGGYGSNSGLTGNSSGGGGGSGKRHQYHHKFKPTQQVQNKDFKQTAPAATNAATATVSSTVTATTGTAVTPTTTAAMTTTSK